MERRSTQGSARGYTRPASTVRHPALWPRKRGAPERDLPGIRVHHPAPRVERTLGITVHHPAQTVRPGSGKTVHHPALVETLNITVHQPALEKRTLEPRSMVHQPAPRTRTPGPGVMVHQPAPQMLGARQPVLRTPRCQPRAPVAEDGWLRRRRGSQ